MSLDESKGGVKGKKKNFFNHPSMDTSASTYPVGSNDALVTELTGNFLVQVQTICSSETAAILVCDMQDVSLNKCSAALQCENDSSMQSYSCNAQQTAQALADSFSKLGSAPTADQTGSIQTLTGALPGATSSSTVGELVGLYAKARCNLRGFSQQDAVYPIIQLTDCSGDTITALNKMDSMTRCSVGALSELVPPDPIAINDDNGIVPVWENPLTMTTMVCMAAVVLCIGILAAVAIANPKR